jgi:DNA-binding NtrC family response regulator
MVVEDESVQRKALVAVLQQQFGSKGLVIEGYADAVQALARARAVPFAVVIADYRLPGMNGVALLKEFRTLQPEATRLMLTASGDIETAVAALNKAEVFRFIRKPWDLDLRVAIVDALARNDELASQMTHHEPFAANPSARTRALRELEASEPGITQVRWGPDGSVLLE